MLNSLSSLSFLSTGSCGRFISNLNIVPNSIPLLLSLLSTHQHIPFLCRVYFPYSTLIPSPPFPTKLLPPFPSSTFFAILTRSFSAAIAFSPRPSLSHSTSPFHPSLCILPFCPPTRDASLPPTPPQPRVNHIIRRAFRGRRSAPLLSAIHPLVSPRPPGGALVPRKPTGR